MKLELLASSGEIVLLEGKTGTGKSYCAKQIHKLSQNSYLRFLQINCTAIADNLFESELFGHKKGSFTGAIADKQGFCSAVGCGTLFLDEIGDLSLEKQAKLLCLLEERIYYQVGSTICEKFRGRVILATNKDLKALVASGEFREDLYYRIRMFSKKLVSLKNKPNLNEIIWNEINNQKVLNQNFKLNISIEARNALTQYDWPGNYRELKNTVKYLFALKKDRIELEDMPRWVLDSEEEKTFLNFELYHDAQEFFEKEYLKKQMKKYSGKINLTAEQICLSKASLISKLKKYGIDRRDYKLNNLGFVSGI